MQTYLQNPTTLMSVANISLTDDALDGPIEQIMRSTWIMSMVNSCSLLALYIHSLTVLRSPSSSTACMFNLSSIDTHLPKIICRHLLGASLDLYLSSTLSTSPQKTPLLSDRPHLPLPAHYRAYRALNISQLPGVTFWYIIRD